MNKSQRVVDFAKEQAEAVQAAIDGLTKIHAHWKALLAEYEKLLDLPQPPIAPPQYPRLTPIPYTKSSRATATPGTRAAAKPAKRSNRFSATRPKTTDDEIAAAIRLLRPGGGSVTKGAIYTHIKKQKSGCSRYDVAWRVDRMVGEKRLARTARGLFALPDAVLPPLPLPVVTEVPAPMPAEGELHG